MSRIRRPLAFVILVVVSLALLLPTPAHPQDDPEALHKEVVRRVIEEAFNQGYVEALDEVVAEDYVNYAPGRPASDRETFKQSILAYRAAMSDLQFTADPIIAEGEWVAFRFTMTGTFENELAFGPETMVPPTGQPFTLTANILARFNEQGQILEEWEEYDLLGLLTQLGMQSAEAGAEPSGEESESAGNGS